MQEHVVATSQRHERKVVAASPQRLAELQDELIGVATDRLVSTDVRLVGQVDRRLTKDVAPPFGGVDINIAEPQTPIKRSPVTQALDPQPRGDNGRVTPYPNGLSARLLVLTLIGVSLVTCFLKEFRPGIGRAIAQDQNHVLIEDPPHRLYVIAFDRRLKLRVEFGDDVARIGGGTVRERAYRQRRETG